jgi:hypothetical protein
MTTRRFDSGDALIGPLYLIALLLIGTPLMDFVSSVLPLRPGELQWRFASVGLLSGFLLTPLLGIVLALGVAIYADHARFIRLLSAFNVGVAVLFVIVLGAFALDILQLRSVVQAEAKAAFEAAAVKAVVKHGCFIVALGWLGIRGFRASRWALPVPKRTPSSIIVGS